MSRSRRRSGGNPGYTHIYTPEAKAPEDEPVDIQFEPIQEEQYFNEDEPVPSSYDPDIAEALDAPLENDPDAHTPDASDLSVDPDAESVLDSAEAEMAAVPDSGTVDDDASDDGGDIEEGQDAEDNGDAQDDSEDAEEGQDAKDDGDAEVPPDDIPPADLEPPVQDTGRTFRQGDVLNDQTALLQADDDAVREQEEDDDVGDRMPVDPDPDDDDDDEDGDDSPYVESDEEPEERDSILFKIPLVGPLFKRGFDLIHKLRVFKRTFNDRRFWISRENNWHNNMVRAKMMKGKEQYVFLHRVWWDLKLGCYRDDITFVKKHHLTKQHPRHLSRYGERAIPDQSTGEWVIFNSKIAPPEYEGENGFTASSAYLFMMDTSGEKAIKESTVDLKSKEGPDRFFIILIAGAFVIIFGYFLLGGFGNRGR